MSAVNYDPAELIRKLKVIPGTLTLWEDLEDLQPDLGRGLSIEMDLPSSHPFLPFPLFKFLVANQLILKEIKGEEKYLMIDMTEKEFQEVTILKLPFVYGISSKISLLFGELDIDIQVHCMPEAAS
jgi:hypothetical protein